MSDNIELKIDGLMYNSGEDEPYFAEFDGWHFESRSLHGLINKMLTYAYETGKGINTDTRIGEEEF